MAAGERACGARAATRPGRPARVAPRMPPRVAPGLARPAESAAMTRPVSARNGVPAPDALRQAHRRPGNAGTAPALDAGAACRP